MLYPSLMSKFNIKQMLYSNNNKAPVFVRQQPYNQYQTVTLDFTRSHNKSLQSGIPQFVRYIVAIFSKECWYEWFPCF